MPIANKSTFHVKNKSFDAEVPLTILADIIKSMSKDKIETLSLLLSPEGVELLERKKDLKTKREVFLTQDEVFDV